MKLHYLPGACSLAPHIVLNEIGKPFEIDRLDLATRKTEKGEDYYTISPNGYVPALRLDDGAVLTEGPAITQYLAEANPNAEIALPADPVARARLRAHLTFIGTELHKSFTPLFQKDLSDDMKQAAKDKIERRLDHVEKNLLGDGRAYLLGDTFSIADAYLFTVAGWTRPTGLGLGDRPHLKAYMERVAARASVQKSMKAEGLTK